MSSWMSHRCALRVILVGWQLLGRFTTVTSFLHLWIMALTVVPWSPKALEMAVYIYIYIYIYTVSWKVFAPFLFFTFFAYLSHLKDYICTYMLLFFFSQAVKGNMLALNLYITFILLLFYYISCFLSTYNSNLTRWKALKGAVWKWRIHQMDTSQHTLSQNSQHAGDKGTFIQTK